MKKINATILILCVSDQFGRELFCGPFHDADLEDFKPEDEEEDVGFFGDNILSIYKLPIDKLEALNDYQSHSSHFLDKFGEEVCLGDYV